jgi:hypothetical protein
MITGMTGARLRMARSAWASWGMANLIAWSCGQGLDHAPAKGKPFARFDLQGFIEIIRTRPYVSACWGHQRAGGARIWFN